jgi:nucleoside-diphosphate-sugar epimerase
VSDSLPLIIIGGNSLVAPWLMTRLRSAGEVAAVISRTGPIEVPEGFTFTAMDLGQARNWIAPENAVIVSLLPLWILAQYLPRFIGVKSIIALGSTSRFSKSGSGDIIERTTAARLDAAEKAFHDWCARSNVHGTLLRATMIYDCVRDANILRIAHFIRRFRFLPLAAPAEGLRQPIHADDAARAIMKALNNPEVYDKAFNIAGGEVLTYRAMVERIFAALDIKPRLLMLPAPWLEKGFGWATRFGVLRETAFGGSMFGRMNQNLIFDTAEGLRLLDYQPRVFRPVFEN